jgi:hypothetical protein
MRSSRVVLFLAWLVLALCSAGVRAQTQSEPTVHQIYQAANSGDLPGASAMADEVLRHHPGSAKAHYVKAELAARQRDAATARAELRTAEQIAPGLPFAKPQAVSALRAQVDQLSRASPASGGQRSTDSRRLGGPPADAAAGSGFPFGGLILLGLVVLVGVVLLRSRLRSQAFAGPQGGAYPGPGAYRGEPAAPYPASPPQRGFEAGNYPPAYPPGYPAAQQPSMGSSLARGLGTGLAVGAGVVAAQEIGRRMFEHGHENNLAGNTDASGNQQSQIARDAGLGSPFDPAANPDLGGTDFGIADGGGWDDAGGGSAGGMDDDWET